MNNITEDKKVQPPFKPADPKKPEVQKVSDKETHDLLHKDIAEHKAAQTPADLAARAKQDEKLTPEERAKRDVEVKDRMALESVRPQERVLNRKADAPAEGHPPTKEQLEQEEKARKELLAKNVADDKGRHDLLARPQNPTHK